MGNPPTHPLLDRHGALVFEDAEHFARVVESELVHGRAMVRFEGPRRLNERLQVHVQAPSTGQRIALGARVVFLQGEAAGLEFTDLDGPRKDLLRSILGIVCSGGAPPPRTPPPARSPSAERADSSPPAQRAEGSAPAQRAEGSAPAQRAESSARIPEAEGSASAPQAEAPPSSKEDAPAIPDPDPTGESAAATPSAQPREGEVASSPSFPPATPPAWSWRGEALEVADPGFLLALYLQALKGPPLGLDAPLELGQRAVELHLGAQRALVEVEVLEGGRLDVPDPSPLVPLLERHTAALARLLAPIGLVDGTADLGAVEGAELLPTSRAPSEPEHAGPPQMPGLEGQTVVFRSLRDLEHERESNVRNGGLFVESEPLPLRQRMKLSFRVGTSPLDFQLEADVVFADAGRVGFSFTNPSEALRRFQSARPVPASRTPSQTGTLDISQPGAATQDLPACRGRIGPPLPLAKVLDLAQYAISDPTELDGAPALLLFEYMARERHTGVLELIDSDEERRCTMFIYQGDVAFVEAKPFDESVSLGRILVGQKKVNENGLREALERARGSHRLLGRMLILLGIIKRGELVAALREQCRAKIDVTFEWQSGQFIWGPWRDPPGDADLIVTRSLGILARHVRVLLDRTPGRDLEQLFGGGMAGVMAVQDLDRLATTLQLQPKEMRFLELQIDGRRTVHDAVTGSPIGRLGSLRLLATCLALGLARFKDGHQSMDLDEAELNATRSGDLDPEVQLDEELKRIRGSNHFDALGVHWSSHQRSYREAWEERRKAYDPGRFGEANPRCQQLAREIQKRLDNAYDALKEAGLRSAYRRKLFDSTERQYAADMLVKQGELALMRGDRIRAIEALETAAELHPNQKVKELLANARETR